MAELLRAVKWQVGVVLCIAAIVAAGWGANAGLSALIGGASYTVPNALFAFRLAYGLMQSSAHASANKSSGTQAGPLPATIAAGASPVNFFLGEFFKIGSCVGVLFLTAMLWPKLVWLAMLAGLLTALKAYLFALFFSR